MTWCTTKGSQTIWSFNSTGVPFGAAFDCSNGRSIPSATSIIDLSQTYWSIDTSIVTWYRTGYLNDDNSNGNDNGAINGVDESNPKYIAITATGSCGVTSVIPFPNINNNAFNGNGLIALKYTGNNNDDLMASRCISNIIQ
jgi:hypothetical protein